MMDLIAIAYPDEVSGAQAAAELDRQADEISVDPDAIGVVICEREGTYHLATSHHPGATTAWSKYWGVLFGFLMGEVDSATVDPEFGDELRDLLRPGTSMLFVAVENVSPEVATEALSQYRGTALSRRLAADEVAALRRELEVDAIRG